MADRYWVGNGGNWSDTAHWSTSSGGGTGASVPTSSDDVYFDANSFSAPAQTVAVNTGATRRCSSMDWTGATNSPTLALATDLEVYGSIFKLVAAMSFTVSVGQVYLYGSASITTNGTTIPTDVLAVSSGTITLLGDITISGEYQQTNGSSTLLTNNYNISCNEFYLDHDVTAVLGTSTITASNEVDFDLSGGGTNELSAASATVVITGSGGYFYANSNQTIGTLTLQATTTLYATGQTIGTLNLTAGKTYTINVSGSNDYIYIGTAFNAEGNIGGYITITSSAPHYFSMASGTVNAEYLALTNSNATGGATWNAYNSTDVSGNTGWEFSFIGKQAVAYSSITKPSTAYTDSDNDSLGILLNSATVTLGDTTYRLNGFTTAQAPNQISYKPVTAYTENY